MYFIQWAKACDGILQRLIGLSRDDMEDWDWRDHFDQGFSPKEAVDLFMEQVEVPENLMDEA